MFDSAALGRRLRQVLVASGVSQGDACEAPSVSRSTYSQIEAGERILKGSELVSLADPFGARAGVIVGGARVRERAQTTTQTDRTDAAADSMREALSASLELDGCLAEHGAAWHLSAVEVQPGVDGRATLQPCPPNSPPASP